MDLLSFLITSCISISAAVIAYFLIKKHERDLNKLKVGDSCHVNSSGIKFEILEIDEENVIIKAKISKYRIYPIDEKNKQKTAHI